MICRPWASSRPAAAITSITMNAGTALLRVDGCNKRLSFSSINSPLLPDDRLSQIAPLLPHSSALRHARCVVIEVTAYVDRNRIRPYLGSQAEGPAIHEESGKPSYQGAPGEASFSRHRAPDSSRGRTRQLAGPGAERLQRRHPD